MADPEWSDLCSLRRCILQSVISSPNWPAAYSGSSVSTTYSARISSTGSHNTEGK